jgi:serine/threonine-protein kinase
MDQTRPIPIPGGENAIHPFFSPDGRWIGFSANNRLVKTPVAGGRPETICETGRAVTGTWLESGVVVFDDTSGLRQCSTAGEVTILLPNDSTGRFLFPHGLPHDRGVLFSVQRDSTTRLAVLDLQTRKVKWLDISGTDPQFVSTGHLVYVSSDGVVRAVPFDSNALTVRGEPVVLDVGVGVELGAAKMALSRTGMIVADPVEVSERALDLVDRSGRAERLSTRLGEFFDPRFSPDGRRIAVGLGGDIWIAERAQKSLTRLTLDSAATRPAWSPDGRRVAYVRQVGRRVELRVIRVDGGAPPESMPTIPGAEPWEVLFTGEGRSVVVRTVGGPGNRDIWLVALDSARPPVPLLRSPANEVAPALSPDGRWLAYVSNESGRAEVYARSFPDIGERVTVSLDGGTEPMWSPRGGELFYRSGSTLIAAQTRTGPAFEVLRRTPLFTNRDYAVDLTHQVYDVSPDGQHFVMIKNLGGARRLSVILHAFENLGVGGSATPGAR